MDFNSVPVQFLPYQIIFVVAHFLFGGCLVAETPANNIKIAQPGIA
jgi:hypothetical protein